MEGVEKAMKKTINKLMKNDMFLKGLSVVLAILCWVYIVFITNPEIEVKITNIPITLSNHQAIKNEGYIVSNEITTTVDIRVKGTRRMLANLNEDSIIAYVDLSECTDKKSYALPVNIKLPYEDISLVSSSVLKIPVAVDNYITKEFPVTYSYSGELKSSAYMINGEPEILTPSVSVSGPEPIVNNIEKAVITIELDNASDDITGFAPVKLLNSNNAEVTSSTMDIKNKDISYRVMVYEEKTVSVQPELNRNTENYSFTIVDGKIKIEGPASEVDDIEAIHTKPFDVDDMSLPATYTAELLVPENITVEDNKETVRVLVKKK